MVVACASCLLDIKWQFQTLILVGVTSVKTDGFATTLSELTTLTKLNITVRHVPDMLHFGSLPASLFRACSGLQTLALNNCGVRAIPAEIACASGLTRLQLLSARPPEGVPSPGIDLPPQFSKLRSLAVLQLSSSALPPPFVSHLTSLHSLTLDQVTADADVNSRSR